MLSVLIHTSQSHVMNTHIKTASIHAHGLATRQRYHSPQSTPINRTPRPPSTPSYCTNDHNSQPDNQPKQFNSTRDFLNSLRATTPPPSPIDTPTSTPTSRAIHRALGVDFGTRRTGIAVSALGLAPRPVEVLDSRGTYVALAQRVVAIAEQQGADGLVVGLPVTRKGNIRSPTTDSQQGRRCRNFAITLATIALPKGLPVVLFDEESTSQSAKAVLSWDGAKRAPKGPVDAVAAAELLTAYFQNPKNAVLVNPPKKLQNNT